MKFQVFKHVLVKNFFALSTLQGINLILPFVTLPYLTSVLGVKNYGIVIMVYSIMQLLLVICDYGFNLSATKEISLYREDKQKVSIIFNSIAIIKVFLLALTLLILIVCTLTIPIVANYKEAYYLGFGIVIGHAMTPLWLFQGMEKMKYMTIVNLASKGSFTVLIFILIKNPEHFVFVPLLYSIGFIIAGILSLYFAFKQFKINFFIPKKEQIKEQLLKSTQYFYSRASVSLYTSSNNFIAGLIFGEYYAGIFGVAERLYTAMTLIYSPLSEAIYPYMVKTKKLILFKKVFIGAFLINLSICLMTFFFSNEIVLFVFGSGYIESAELLKYFCLLALIIVPTTFIGYPLLGAFGYERYANYSVVVASLIHVIILSITYLYLDIYKMVFLLIITQLIVLSIRVYGVRLLMKNKYS